MSPLRLGMFLLAAVLMSAPAAHAVTFGQVDDFEDGGLAGWDVGGADETNVSTGGPDGVDDNYLELETTADVGPGSRVGIRNLGSWLGDYTSAGVTGIRVDLNNFSATALEIRVIIDGDGGAYTSTSAFALGASSGWTTATFDLTASGLTGVGGSDLSATLGNVTNILIRHDPGSADGFAPGAVPEVATGTIVGFDNIQAVPEPATLALIASGGLALVARRRRRGARR